MQVLTLDMSSDLYVLQLDWKLEKKITYYLPNISARGRDEHMQWRISGLWTEHNVYNLNPLPLTFFFKLTALVLGVL